MDPHVKCDTCGQARPVTKSGGIVYQWFLNRRKVPGWFLVVSRDHFKRDEDYCSEACYKARKTERSEVPKAKPEGPNPPVTPELPKGDRP